MSHTALVIIDIQNDISKHYRDIIHGINAAVDWAASKGMQIVYILHNIITAEPVHSNRDPKVQNWFQN